MDLKVVFVVVFLSALAITSTDAGIPSCCMKIQKIQKRMFRKAERWERQYSHGACDIDALVLYERGKTRPYCVHPKMEERLAQFRKIQKKRQTE